MFSLLLAWTNCWNSIVAADLRHRDGHMVSLWCHVWCLQKRKQIMPCNKNDRPDNKFWFYPRPEYKINIFPSGWHRTALSVTIYGKRKCRGWRRMSIMASLNTCKLTDRSVVSSRKHQGNIEVPYYSPYATGDVEFPTQRASNADSVFHVLTLSWFRWY